jgi:hypothetical protein
MSGTERLLNLLSLADQGPAMRAALAEEVADLLTDWPGDCPLEMRGACEALLARAAREVDAVARARLRIRLFADAALAARVLPREAPERNLVDSARAGDAMEQPVARALGVSEQLAGDILKDRSGRALAVAAKAIGLNRSAFSALALLAQSGGDLGACYARLDAFDAISASEAARELRGWVRPPPAQQDEFSLATA